MTGTLIEGGTSTAHEALPAVAELYFEAEGSDTPTARRAILISYHFPPDPVVGALRWQEMTRHLAERGWAVDVITRNFSGIAAIDRAKLLRLPRGTRVLSVADREPLLGRLQRALLVRIRRVIARTDRLKNARPNNAGGPRFRKWGLVRAYLGWLDVARNYNWARRAAGVAMALARDERYDVVISSGPPHMAHLAAQQVARAVGLPLVVDMRDPWSLVERLSDDISSPLWYYLARRYEARVIEDAALVTMNTEPACNAMRAHYPAFADRIEVVRNGCDDEPLPVVQRDGVFRIRFAGSIYLDRDPRLVFRAVSRVVKELGIAPRQLAIEFVGEVDHYAGTPTTVIAQEEGIADFVSVGGFRSHQETLEFLAGATMLLSLPQDSDLAIPAKIYEYVRMPAWMLVLAHRDSATAQLLQRTQASVVDPSDVDLMVDVVRRRFEEFSRGVMPTPVGADGRFDRLWQSETLLRLLYRRLPRIRS